MNRVLTNLSFLLLWNVSDSVFAEQEPRIAGRWDITVQYIYGSAVYTAYFEQQGKRLTGTYRGRHTEGELEGTVHGERIEFRGSLRIEGMRLVYDYSGTIDGTKMSGTVGLDEYGTGKWTAVKRVKSG